MTHVAPPQQSPRVLGLCSGIGGLELAVRSVFPNSRLVGLVERDPYAASILLARMEEEALEPCPVWCGDLNEFDAASFAGRVDLLTAGFPCQPFSSASRGRRVALDLWPEVLRVVREVRPGAVFVENVARLPMVRARRQLRSLGYRCGRHIVTDSAAVGAPHRRVRSWLLAHADEESELRGAFNAKVACIPTPSSPHGWEEGPGAFLGVDAGIPDRMDRLRCLGNAVVPAQGAAALRELLGRFE